MCPGSSPGGGAFLSGEANFVSKDESAVFGGFGLSSEKPPMPELARFFGIIITIYMEINAPHQVPHFHVRYNEYRASYSIG